MRPDTLRVSLLSSIAIHICAIVIAAVSFHPKAPRSQNYFPVHLIETSRAEISRPEPVAPSQIKTTPAPVRKAESRNKEKHQPAEDLISKPESKLAARKPEPLMPPETKAPAANHPESTPPALPSKVARMEAVQPVSVNLPAVSRLEGFRELAWVVGAEALRSSDGAPVPALPA